MDADIERAIDELFARQYGVAATWQLRNLGVTTQQVRRRAAAGRWVREASRVVALAGSPPSPERQLLLAVLQAGPTALASHRSAAWLWRLPGFSTTDEVLRSRAHGAPATEGHRPKLLLPHHRTVVRSIPVTSLPRTIFDLAPILPVGRLARLIDTVHGRSPAMLAALHRTLPELAVQGRPGITVMRQLLAERPIGSRIPPTGLERRFEQILSRAGIRGFERQVDLGGHSWLGRVDYLRRDVRLIAEVDSDLHHRGKTDVDNDEARDAALIDAGYAKVVRIDEEAIWYEPWRVVEEIRAALRELGAEAA